ncbi:MAG: hypothetical protein HY606_02150, partial [Planctomycetes bacterium]|nr:hypothetical protein [Planctomycetota bacterium]
MGYGIRNIRYVAEVVLFSFVFLICWSGLRVQAVDSPQNIYYVDSDKGSDDSDGRSTESPVKTLKKGVSLLNRSGGDTLLISGIFNETLELNNINRQSGDINNDRYT